MESRWLVDVMRALDFAARSIVASPPVHWDAARKRAYFEWAAEVVAGCRGVSPQLEARFDEAYRDGLAALG